MQAVRAEVRAELGLPVVQEYLAAIYEGPMQPQVAQGVLVVAPFEEERMGNQPSDVEARVRGFIPLAILFGFLLGAICGLLLYHLY
ncbi:signal peptidase I [Sesbania bispinosa]|nr:signal peptidase I [Sesbania bispinosa]